MSDGRPDFAGVGPIRQGHGIDCKALANWLQAHVPQFVGPLEVQQFKGGQSNPTYRLRTPSTDYVLRRKPPGPILKGAHAVEREFRVLSALDAAGFPVARPFALCADEAVIGTPFFVMEMVEGRIFWEPSLPSLPAVERTAGFDAMNATLARLHNLAPAEIGLADYGRPDNYLARQVARWSQQYGIWR
jgi:aminoglycoside phosphotransferase (APT) family kinase protein